MSEGVASRVAVGGRQSPGRARCLRNARNFPRPVALDVPLLGPYGKRMTGDGTSGDERFPVQRIREADYELLIFWGSELEDPGDDNLDIEVRTLDGRFSASVFTLRNVVSLLDKYRANGEEPSSYFRCPDAVIVDEPITEMLLRTLVADAIATGDLAAWERLHDELDDGDDDE
jgi:hypothetical protein